MNVPEFRNRLLFVCMCIISLSLLISCIDPVSDPDTEPDQKEWACVIEDNDPDFSYAIGCETDFKALASEPLDASIPGAISGKTVIDQDDPDVPLYFQNSKKYQIHHDFCSAKLSGANDLPIVPDLGAFSGQYTNDDRRFILGAITYYQGPGVWVYEIAPYDNASADQIEFAFNRIRDSVFFGDSLYFHPSSTEGEAVAKNLSDSIPIMLTDSLFKAIDYQALNYGTSYGKLLFVTADELATAYVNFRDIVVLDKVPNDISVTCGIVTEMFQTPLAHINVLSQNRGTPNMGLRGAFTNDSLLALKGKWVKYTVGPSDWSITEATQEEADAWWEENQPDAVGIAAMDLITRELRDIEDILPLDRMSLGEAIDSAIPAFGGKASHFASFPHMDTTKVPYPKAFAVPVYYYWQFMEQNGFNTWVADMLADNTFNTDPKTRDETLEKLRDSMMVAPLDSAFEEQLFTKLNTDFNGVRMRFRSSTNAEDLDGFTGAGLYTSKSGWDRASVRDAIREVWASVWFFRAFEERSYRRIQHESVGMALLVHRSFPTEEANGVAITANIYDESGNEPAFYINVQDGGLSVVLPDPDITTDQIVYYFYMKGEPIEYRGHSSEVPQDSTVLTKRQIHTLGVALNEIHNFFKPLYGNDPNKWYAMDTEFKFDQPLDDPDGEPVLFMKQARPYPGLNSANK
jgi:pyruvate, water dikinase